MAATKKTAVTKTTTAKPVAAPRAPRTRKAVAEVKAEAAPITRPTATKNVKGIKTDVFDISGKVVSSAELPPELFGARVSKQLMAQAVRVYLTNQRRGTVSTKTRGEVEGSTRKIYRQKGTGRARHGGITAPIFVGGGIALGPKPREFNLSMPQKMRRAALSSALTAKFNDGQVKVVDGLEKIEPKTKNFVDALRKLSLDEKKKKVLLVLPAKTEALQKAARNVEGVNFIMANQLNTYDVLNNKTILLLKPAIETLNKTFSSQKSS